MGVLQSKHGVFYVRKKVPKRLEAATAQALGAERPRVSWLKRSLNTKDKREANILAKPVLIEFDKILARAEAALLDTPLRSDLSDQEIERIANYHYGAMLAEDEEWRREGPVSEELFQSISKHLSEAGVPCATSFKIEPPPAYGLSDREMTKAGETLEAVLPLAQHALARGDVSHIKEEMDELLDAFRLNVDRRGPAFLRLGQAVLRKHVSALQALQRRHQGEPIETPRVSEPTEGDVPQGGSLRAALDGWKKSKSPSASTLREFEYAIRRFVELHGDLPVAEISRSKVREYREALQLIPVRRSGQLLTAPLPQLVEWSREHPECPRLSAASVNKLLAAPQALATWARDNGLIPDDLPWANPFSKMYLEQAEPDRDPWVAAELELLFSSPIFTSNLRPVAGRGDAAYWLPLLGLFTGARLGELAPLAVGDVVSDITTGITYIRIVEDDEQGRRLKTMSSRRAVPVHNELIKIGFLRLVEQRRSLGGDNVALFPLLTPGPKGGYGETWSKWFGRYIRGIGISNKASVFHSFRHGFKDALRAAGVSEDLNDALTGHSGGGVGRRYGAKEMARRFGLPRLAEAVAKIKYPGLDLSHLEVSRELP